MKKIKIGIFGAGRGTDMGRHFLSEGCEIVALCDFIEHRLEDGLNRLGKHVPVYTNFDDFLKVEMDAVILANYFHEHAPYIIRCFEKNISVFCECISNGTMGEGVMLHNAFKKTKSIFMLAENYPQLKYAREIKRVCDTGTLGKFLYAEGEYNHPTADTDVSFLHDYNYFTNHWRNYLPATYYITHSLGPIMYAVGAKPKIVSAFAIFDPYGENVATAKQNADRNAIITTLNNDGSIYRITGCAHFGAHHNSYRVCGSKGSIENLRGLGDKVMLRYNSWDVPEGMQENNLIEPKWNVENSEGLDNFDGHGGADVLTVRYFIKCLKENVQPEFPFDLESAIIMSSVAILGHRSVIEKGKPYNIPDFNNEKDRNLYENDFSTPFYNTNGEKPTIQCCSNKDYKASDEQINKYKEVLRKTGIDI